MYLRPYLGRVALKLADLIAIWNRHDLSKVKVALSLSVSLSTAMIPTLTYCSR